MKIQISDFQSLKTLEQRKNALTIDEVRTLILKLQNALFDMKDLERATRSFWFLILEMEE